MKLQRISLSILLLTIFQLSCHEEEQNIIESPLSCEFTTEKYGGFIVKYFDQDPMMDLTDFNEFEEICWNDIYPFVISSGGTGKCGEGYEDVSNPNLATGAAFEEYNLVEPQYSSRKRYFDVNFTFSCDDFSTQEQFYSLITERDYKLASGWEDFGKMIVEYNYNGERYWSLDYDNSDFKAEVSQIEQYKPQFNTEPNGGNGLPASIGLKITFSCILKSETNKYLYIENAEVKGRLYRQHPWGYYWEDWGKGWDG